MKSLLGVATNDRAEPERRAVAFDKTAPLAPALDERRSTQRSRALSWDVLALRLLPRVDCHVDDRGAHLACGRASGGRVNLVRIDRSLCRYMSIKRIPGANPLDERKSVVLRARKAAPFHNAGSAVLWGRTWVSIYFWDADKLLSTLAAADLSLGPDHLILPSTFFETRGDGFELRHYDHGSEAQIWSDGSLRVSRWWPNKPTPVQLEQFALGNATAGTIGRPRVHLAEMSERPRRLALQNLPETFMMFKGHLIALVLAVNLPLLAYEAGAYAQISQNLASLERSQAGLKPQERQIMDARGEAIERRNLLRSYAAAGGNRQPMGLFLEFLENLGTPADQFTVKLFELSKQELRAVLVIDNRVNVRNVVESLEAHARFERVISQTDARTRELRVTARIKSQG